MRMEDMILVSVDDHLLEPPTVFSSHLPRRFLDQAPRIVEDKRGRHAWQFGDHFIPAFADSPVVGRVPEERGADPQAFDEVRKGTFDVHARIEDMNANGMLASMNFPNMPGFAGELFVKTADRALALALLQAHNDWHMEDWCGAYPGRFIPLALIPWWDPALSAAEIRRMARRGARAISFPANPSFFGLPSIHRDDWNPVFKACVEEDVVVCIHLGSDGGMRFPSLDSPYGVGITTLSLALADAAADFIHAPIIDNFPAIRFALSEGQIGWIPYFKERLDYTDSQHRFWTHQDFKGRKPSELYRKYFLNCFFDDAFGIKNRHAIGIETIAWECDYPHPDCTWPEGPERLWKTLQDLPKDEIDLITHGNAMRYFRFDPFECQDRAACTVGALRAKARHVDVSPRQVYDRPTGPQPVVTAGMFKEALAQNFMDFVKGVG